MRLAPLLILALMAFATANAASVGKIAPAGVLGVSLTAEFKSGNRTDLVYFEQRLLGYDRVWVGGRPAQKGSRRLSAAEAAQCKMSLRRAIYEEVGVAKANTWLVALPAPSDDRAHWLAKLYRQVSARGRPELTEALANEILLQPTLAHAIEVLDEPDLVRDPAPDDPSLSLHVWGDRVDDYRATELRVYCDPAGAVSRALLSSYLIKNPPLTAADVERVRARGTFAAAEEAFGPDSNYVALSRNNGGAALWATSLDGQAVEITAVVDKDGRLARLLVTAAPPAN